MAVIGYIRVSSNKQTLEHQHFEIEQYAKNQGLQIDTWVEEKISSRKALKNRKLGTLLDNLQENDILFDVPTMYNNQPFEELINFIKETEVIITNTYHIMYWSTLLGKKVILFGIFSDKFNHFKYPPVLYSGDLEHDMAKAQRYPEALQESQRLNLDFFEDVKKILEQ